MTLATDMSGKHVGTLTVLARAGSNTQGAARWRCRCQCGNDVVVTTREIMRAKTPCMACRDARRARQLALRAPRKTISASALRAEGVIDFGIVESIAFVATAHGLHLFHVLDLPTTATPRELAGIGL